MDAGSAVVVALEATNCRLASDLGSVTAYAGRRGSLKGEREMGVVRDSGELETTVLLAPPISTGTLLILARWWNAEGAAHNMNDAVLMVALGLAAGTGASYVAGDSTAASIALAAGGACLALAPAVYATELALPLMLWVLATVLAYVVAVRGRRARDEVRAGRAHTVDVERVRADATVKAAEITAGATVRVAELQSGAYVRAAELVTSTRTVAALDAALYARQALEGATRAPLYLPSTETDDAGV
jgi:hypothetical protein